MFQDSGLQDKTVVVTGGSGDIGRAMVRLFAQQGADVNFFYYNNKKTAQALVDELRQAGHNNVSTQQLDVSDRDQCEQAIENIYQRTQRMDVLVNSSGIVRDNVLVGLTNEDIQQVLEVNVLGVFNVTQCAVPFMMSQRSGKIINISSVAGEKGGRGQVNYAASKGAVNAFTRALAVELARKKIKVNAVAPGIIDTKMARETIDHAGDQLLSRILLRRYGQPEEVAYAVLFLASKYADYITGEIIRVDGGCCMD